MAVTPGANETGEVAGARIEVDPLPPAPETPPPQNETASAGAASSSSAAASDEWTDADLKELRSYISMPYEVVATTAHAPYFAIDQDEANMIAAPLSRVVPVSWVRETKRRSPVLAALTALGAIYIVTAPRLRKLAEERARATGAGGEDRSRPTADRAPNGDARARGHGEGAAGVGDADRPDGAGGNSETERERPRLSVVDL